MIIAKNTRAFRLPDRPDREPDDMTSYRQLTATSIIEPLQHYLGNLDTTLITGDQYLIEAPAQNLEGSRYPDLMIAFDADIESHQSNNGYIIAEQGKPPDFILEIASRSTGSEDVGDKRRDYARMGVPEYWRFDETPTGRWHGARLAGDLLENNQYRPIPIEPLPGDVLQGYSPTLNVYLRWGKRAITLVQSGPPATTSPPSAMLRNTPTVNMNAPTGSMMPRLQAEARARQLEAELENLRNR